MPIPDAGYLVKGITELDVDPAGTNPPVAVGVNSPREEKNLTVDYLDVLSDAITDLGSTEAFLVISRPVTVTLTADLAIPANITLDIRDQGLLTIAGGYKLEIGSIVEASNRQIFAPDDDEEIYLLRGATSFLNFAWWAGGVPSGDCDWAMKQCMLSLEAGTGGRLVIPPGEWEVSGTYEIPDRSIIEGCGPFTYANNWGTKVKLIGAEQEALFTITGSYPGNIVIRDILLEHGPEVENGTAVLKVVVGSTNMIGLLCKNVIFNVQAFEIEKDVFVWRTDYDVMIDGDGQYEAEDIAFYDCLFSGGNAAGVYINTVNGTLSFLQPNFNMPSLSDGFYLASCGQLNVWNHNAGGIHGSPGCVDGEPDPIRAGKVFNIVGPHVGINITGGQDEGFA